jgi:hypothetical protein
MSESSPLFDAKKLVRRFTNLDPSLVVRNLMACPTPTESFELGSFHRNISKARAEEYRYTDLVVDDIENSIQLKSRLKRTVSRREER